MDLFRRDSTARVAWDLVIVLCGCFVCVLVTFQAVFVQHCDPVSSLIIYGVDLLFLCDIWINFKTPIRVKGEFTTEGRVIAGHYRRTHLPVDLVACLPFDLFFLALVPWNAGMISVVLLVRLLRLGRLARLLAVWKRWNLSSRVNPGMLRIGVLLVTVLLVTHFVACGWFAVGMSNGGTTDSWVTRYNLDDENTATQYIRSLYWAITTMTTVGYGDITPAGNWEYLFSSFVMLLGASIYALVIANVASLLSNLDAAKAAFHQRMAVIRQYLLARGVAPSTYDLVRDYYDYVWHRYRGSCDIEFLEDLPNSLRIEILHHLTQQLVEQVPLLRDASHTLRDALLLALKSRVFAPNTMLIRESEKGDSIMFLSKGSAEIVSLKDDKSHGHLEAGDFFGLLSLILEERRTASVRASSYCDVFVLEKDDFDRIRSEYPEFKELLASITATKTDMTAALVADGVIL